MKQQKNLARIVFKDIELVVCPNKQCEIYGDYYKCYFDELYKQCPIYDPKNLLASAGRFKDNQ